MNRFPFRIRGRLVAAVNYISGVLTSLLAVGAIAGVATDQLTAWQAAIAGGTAVALGVIDWLASVKLITDGEDETTPLVDPRDTHGIALIPWTEAERWAAEAKAASVIPSGAVFADTEGTDTPS